MLSLRLRFLPVDIDVLAQAGREHADAAARLDLAAIVTDVLYARFRVRGNPVRASRVRAVVEARRGDRHRKLIQAESFLVELVTDVNHILTFRVADRDRSDRLGKSLLPLCLHLLDRVAAHAE